MELMQRWLQDCGASATPAPGGADMQGHDMPGHQMPGAGTGDMTALQNAQGAEAGRLFLTQMIEHHRGAMTMQEMLDK
ncbi:DUF305 domain-containing protein [Mycolicibacterium arenosum]|uniref:DUF305 domain-containing protein n=1 Tax=Mycolicibacterium arenosum TaxID=2952157 RepID=UPI0038CDA084